MSVGILGKRFRGASLAMELFGTSVVGAFAGAAVQVGGAAYDTLVADSDGFATGHGLADGKLIVPPGLGGLYRVRAIGEISPLGGVAEIRATLGATFSSGDFREDAFVCRPLTAAANPILQMDLEYDVALAEGTLANVNVRCPTGPAGNYDFYGVLFSLTYLGRS